MASEFSDAVTFSLLKLGLSGVSLKEEQLSSIKAAYEGKDVFVCLPTGYGKSLCYQTLPFVMDHKYRHKASRIGHSAALVVSPLISLMADQVSSLRKRGVKASIISSTSAVPKEMIATESSLASDSLFFCAPEALVATKWRDALEQDEFSGRMVAIVVDEAHCVSQW